MADDGSALTGDPAEGRGPFRPRGRARGEHVSRRIRRVLRSRWDILVAIAAGGAVGSLARWGLTLFLPHAEGAFPWATFVANVTGCGLLGVLMVFVIEVWPPSRYVRPFLGVGVLGGYTTFSAYMLDARALLVAGRAALAGAYVFGSLASGLVAVWAAVTATRLLVRILERRRADRRGRTGERRRTRVHPGVPPRAASAGPAPASPDRPETSMTRSTP